MIRVLARLTMPVRCLVALAILNKSQNQVRLQAIETRKKNNGRIDPVGIPARNPVNDPVSEAIQ